MVIHLFIHSFCVCLRIFSELEVPVEKEYIPMQTFLEYNEEVAELEEFWTWEEHGLELLFRDEIHDEVPENRVSVTAAPKGDEFILPENTESASIAFLIQCPFDLKNKVQIKIPHYAAKTSTDQYKLSFAVSKDLTPPFKFELVDGGEFVQGKGEMAVESFSWWKILYVFNDAADFCKSVESIWSNHEYIVFLYRKTQHMFFEPNEFSWGVHFLAVKNVESFQREVKKYALENSLTHVTHATVKFSETSSLKLSKLPDQKNGWSMSCKFNLTSPARWITSGTILRLRGQK